MSLVSEDLAVLRVRIWDRIDRRVLATLVVSAAAHVAFIAWARSAEAAHDKAPVVSFGDSDRFADPVVRLPPTALPAPLPTTTPGSDPGSSKPGTATPSANPSHPGPRSGPARVTDDGARTNRFLDLLGRRTLDGRGTLSPGDDRTVDIDRALDPGAKINRDGWDPSRSRGDDGTAISAGDRQVSIGGPGDVDTGDKGDDDLPVRKPPPGDQPDQPSVSSAGGEDIARTIRKRYMAGFTRCYEHVFSPKNAAASGRMEAEIEVSVLGAVSDIGISLPDALDDSAFEHCLEQHIRTFRFGARSKPATVTFPFLFIASR